MSTSPQQTLKLPPAPSKMRLDALVRGRIEEPRRVLLYGPEGIGKTTFGASAPAPIFLCAESGTAQLDVVRFPTPENWTDVLEAVRTLTNDSHDFKTLVIDTLDWVEPLLWGHMVKRDTTAKDPLTNIEDYGYGKGFNRAVDDWRILLARLEQLRAAKGMNIIFLAHSWIKPFKNPEGPDYDRYELKVHNKAAGVLKEWCDAVLFANYETHAHEDKKKRVRGVDTGSRLIFTVRTGAYDAKNRYSLPATLPLSWADFDGAVRSGQVAPPAVLREEIERKAKELGGDIEKKTADLLKQVGNDTQKLSLLNNRLNAKLADKEN